MTDEICTELEELDGIINAYSWPTGMRNDGPEEYSIYYNTDQLEYNDVAKTLQEAVETHVTPGVYLGTSRSDPTDPNRINADMATENEDYPSLNAQVFIHEDAFDLQNVAKDIDDLVFWNVEWDAEGGRDMWHDVRYLIENPDAGVLNIFFELDDHDQYDAVVDMIHNTVQPKTVEVSQADSDGYYVQVTRP